MLSRLSRLSRVRDSINNHRERGHLSIKIIRAYLIRVHNENRCGVFRSPHTYNLLSVAPACLLILARYSRGTDEISTRLVHRRATESQGRRCGVGGFLVDVAELHRARVCIFFHRSEHKFRYVAACAREESSRDDGRRAATNDRRVVSTFLLIIVLCVLVLLYILFHLYGKQKESLELAMKTLTNARRMIDTNNLLPL